MDINYGKQHELGIVGLALLRNWLVGDDKTILSLLSEATEIFKDGNHGPDKKYKKIKKV